MTKEKVVDLPQKKISTQMDDILQEIRSYIQSAERHISELDVWNEHYVLEDVTNALHKHDYSKAQDLTRELAISKRASNFLGEAMALIDDTRLDVIERYGFIEEDNS